MDVDSETSETFEDFHPSSLLEVEVKEANDQESKKKSNSSPQKQSALAIPPKPVVLHRHQSGDSLTPNVIPEEENIEETDDKQKRIQYWRTCFLCQKREYGGKDSPLSYHKFPADERLCQHWKKICNLNDTRDVTNLKVCSKHFKPEDYVDPQAKTWGGILKLKLGAIPSLSVPKFVPQEPKQYVLVAPCSLRNPVTFMKSKTATSLIMDTKQSNSPVVVKKENIVPEQNENDSESDLNSSTLPLNDKDGTKKDEPIPYWRNCFLCKCKEPGGKASQVALHKFPADTRACRLWKQVCNLSERDDVSNLKLCSKHFHSEDYMDVRAKLLGGKLKLKPGIVPSIAVPNPLTSPGGPKKYFIVSNKGPLLSAFTKDGQPAKLLNVILHDQPTVGGTKPTNTITRAGIQSVSTVVKVEKSPTSSVAKAGSIPVGAAAKGGSRPTKVSSSPTRTGMKVGSIPVSSPTKSGSTSISTVTMAGNAPVVSTDSKETGAPHITTKKTGNLSTNTVVLAGSIPIGTLIKMGNVPVGTPVKVEMGTVKKKGNTPTVIEPVISPDGSPVKRRLVPLSSLMAPGSTPPNTFTLLPNTNRSNLTSKSDSNTDLTKQSKSNSPKETTVPRKSSSKKSSNSAVSTAENIRQTQQPRVLLTRLSPAEIEKHTKRGILVEEEDPKCVKISKESSEDQETVKVKKVRRGRRCYLCGLEEGKESNVALHKFPADPDICREWKKICDLYEQDDVSRLRLCSRHFTPEDFPEVQAKQLGGLLKVKPRAVPSVDVPNPPEAELIPEVDIKSEPIDEFHPSNLLEVIVNEFSPKKPVNEEKEHQSSDMNKKNLRSCFLCHFKEGRDKHSAIMLHEFPKDKIVSGLWKQVCNLHDHDYANISSLLICSNHFVAEDYFTGKKAPINFPILKRGAIPSVSVPNPLRTLTLTTLGSIEPESVAEMSHINPLDFMEMTYDTTVDSEIINKINNSNAVKSAITETDRKSNVSSVLKTKRELQPIGNLPNILSSPQFLMVPRCKTSNKEVIKNVIIKKQNPDNYVHPTKAVLNTMEKIASTKPVYVGKNLASNQTLKIMHSDRNSFQTIQLPPSTIQLMPPLKLAMGPSGMYLQNHTPGRAANFADNASQTSPLAQRIEQSCQTEEGENMDLNDQDLAVDFASPPLCKKRRISLSLVDTSTPEDTLNGSGPKTNCHCQFLEQQKTQIKKQIATLGDLVNHLQTKNLLSKDAADILMCSLSVDCRKMIAKTLQRNGEFVWDLKAFALTLHTYSIPAYNYVQNVWPDLVPENTIIKNSFTVGNGKPGFTQEVLDAIKLESRFRNKRTLCNIVISEMPLRQQILFENNRFYGGVDLGTNQNSDTDDIMVAQNVLIFFVSALDASWSAPVGYFLIRSLNAKERANLLVKCLNLLHDAWANVVSITLDGSPLNTSMCCHLGANISYAGVETFQPWFVNPATREKVFVFYDPCSMMLLVRNTLGDKGTLHDSENKTISWSYISELCRIQSLLTWDVDTKLRETHANYQTKRTDVKLCLQTLSRSVYKGFMSVLEKNMECFEGCYSTAVYCLMFNNIFDMLNCRNKFSKKKYRVAITDDTIKSLRNSASVFIKYISSLKDSSGMPILNSSRRTGFLGFIVSLTNIFDLYETGKALGLKHLFSQKLSLDFVRIFCSAIQCSNDSHLNAKEFETMYKKLVLKNSGKNFQQTDCLVDAVDILHLCGQKESYMDPICNYKDRMADKWIDCDVFQVVLSLKFIIEDVLKYICGFVVNKILSKKLCTVCAEHLVEDLDVFLKKKTQNKNIAASKDVYRICKTAEVVLRENRATVEHNSDLKFLVTKTFYRVGEMVFNTEKMRAHVLEQDIFDNHMTQLCKLVTATYLDMSIFHESAT